MNVTKPHRKDVTEKLNIKLFKFMQYSVKFETI